MKRILQKSMQPSRGVLLINLGTPKKPSFYAVFKYLNEFLTDPKVIDLPWLKRQLLVRGVIIPTRLMNSTKSYQAIWTKEGSPLLVYGNRVKALLQKELGSNYIVELGMRYQTPSIHQALKKLYQNPLSELTVIPLFPQYADATTGSILDQFFNLMRKFPPTPKLKIIEHFCNHPSLMDAFKAVSPPNLHSYDHILMSFHGLPEKHLQRHCLTQGCCQKYTLKDPHCYLAQCYATAQGLAQSLNLSKSQYSVCFQSRLGKDPWIRPYASDQIETLAKKGAKNVLVFCPSFVSDCLETIFEIGVEYQELFHRFGGKKLELVPGLNDHPQFINTLKNIVTS